MFLNPGGGPFDFITEVLENWLTFGLSYKLVYYLKPKSHYDYKILLLLKWSTFVSSGLSNYLALP
jgi:hypothetical protein